MWKYLNRLKYKPVYVLTKQFQVYDNLFFILMIFILSEVLAEVLVLSPF